MGVTKLGSLLTANGLVLLEQHEANASASLDFTNFISSAYDEYVFELINILPATNDVSLRMRMGTGVGPSWDSGSNYGWATFIYRGGGTDKNGADTGQTSISLTYGSGGTVDISNAANDGGYSGHVRLFGPSSSIYKSVESSGRYKDAEPFRLGVTGWGVYLSTTALTGVQFLMSSGNITSGTIRVYGVPKYGTTSVSYAGVLNGYAPLDASLKIPLSYVRTPDSPPVSANAFDDEFTTTSTFSSTLGSLDSNNTSDVSGALRLRKTSTGSFQLHGVYKTAPSTPFTVTCKISFRVLSANFQQYGIMLLDSTPTAIYVHGPTYQSTNGIPEFVYGKWTNRTTRGTITEYAGWYPYVQYIRLVCNSSSSVDIYVSVDNITWIPLNTAQNPGFTIANVGLFVTGNDNSTYAEAYFEWVRFS